MDTTEQLKNWAKNMTIWFLQRYNCRGAYALHVVSSPESIVLLPAALQNAKHNSESIDWDQMFTQINKEIMADASIMFSPPTLDEAERRCQNIISVCLRMTSENQRQYAYEFAAQTYIEYYMLQQARPEENPSLERILPQIPDKLAMCLTAYPEISLPTVMQDAKDYVMRQFSIVSKVTLGEIKDLAFRGLNNEHVRLYAASVQRAEKFTRENCGKIDISDAASIATLQEQSERVSRAMVSEHFKEWDNIKSALKNLCDSEQDYERAVSSMLPKQRRPAYAPA